MRNVLMMGEYIDKFVHDVTSQYNNRPGPFSTGGLYNIALFTPGTPTSNSPKACALSPLVILNETHVNVACVVVCLCAVDW